MYKIYFILLLLAPLAAYSQILKDFDEKLERKVSKKVEEKVDRNIDKVLDKADSETDKPVDDALTESSSAKKKAPKKSDKPAVADPDESTEGVEAATNVEVKVNSNYDFEPGNKLLFSDDFEKDAIGDFPAKWNTNGSGEIISMEGIPGKWISIPDNTITFAETDQVLPENFTIEFDLVYLTKPGRSPLTFGFSENKNPAKDGLKYKKIFYFKVDHASDIIASSSRLYSGGESTKEFPVAEMAGKVIHVGIAVNKSRIRLYMDEEKVFDLPRAFEPSSLRNNFHFRAAEILPASKKPFYISNLRIAEAGTDARSAIVKEWMEKGNVSTNEIQFDFNSDKIKSSSFGIINGFGQALKENNYIRVKIIGHTDNIGKDAYNQELSTKRANAVKAYLIKNYNISEDRIQTEGEGAGKPVASNDSEEGRALNRRVEFVKIN
ncbi:MAG TPA: OmpA family protein [Cytophagales bacterium]|nr:OmpA family protein [Cytophagales bacterium]